MSVLQFNDDGSGGRKKPQASQVIREKIRGRSRRRERDDGVLHDLFVCRELREILLRPLQSRRFCDLSHAGLLKPRFSHKAALCEELAHDFLPGS